MSGAGRAALLLGGIGLACLAAGVVDGFLGVDPLHLGEPGLGPSLAHPLGTDELGRDLLSRLLHGGRMSLGIAAVAAALSVGIGGGVGLLAGFSGGVSEQVLMRTTEVLMALPKLPVLLLLASLGGLTEAAGLPRGPVGDGLAVAVMIGALSWMDVARLVRAAARQLRDEPFVIAARALGLGRWAVIRRHLLPHLAGPLGVSLALELSQAVLFESSLSFLGLGLQPPTPSWGRLLAESFNRIHDAPVAVVAPGLLTLGVVAASQRLAEAHRARHALAVDASPPGA